jgi:hypothetical protein
MNNITKIRLDKGDKKMSEIYNTTTVSYEDQSGTKYSCTNVLTVDLDEKSETTNHGQVKLVSNS